MESLFNLLQKEFCPPLDSSLIAALLAELQSDAEGNSVSPSLDQIDSLYATCSALALQADESQQSEFSESDILQTSQIDETISSCTTPDYNHEQSSNSSDSSQHSFASPLGFLQTALPDVPISRLRGALLHAEKEDFDMWDIVASILTEESILEMEERGLDGLEEEEGVLFLGGIDFDWQTVESKKKPSTKAGKRKIRPRLNKVTLNDIRQQHHNRGSPSSSTRTTNGKLPTVGAAPDPWTQISSLSTHIASLLPPHPPSFFQSYFHSPIHTTSYDALRAALTSLCKNKQDAVNYTTIVSNITDILLENGDVDPELKGRITADIRLSVTVTDGRDTDALDLVDVLRDLDTRPDMGLFHLSPTRASDSNGDVKASGSRLPFPSSPLVIPPPSPFEVKLKIKPPSSTSGNKPSPYQWHIVPQRRIFAHNPSPHIHHIPAYARDVNGIKTHRDSGKIGSEDDEYERRMAQATRAQRELLQEATKMWQKGNAKTHGGEVAQQYAERSNQLLTLAKKEALNLARAKVQASSKPSEVDFHGVNVENATIIIQEILEKRKSSISQGGFVLITLFHCSILLSLFSISCFFPTLIVAASLLYYNSFSLHGCRLVLWEFLSVFCSGYCGLEAKPLTIVTGSGTHSVNKKSVLKPALRKVLDDDGWLVSEWTAGLVVRGRRANT